MFLFVIKQVYAVIKWLVYANLLVALLGFWLTYSFASYFELEQAIHYGITAFGATLFSYNFQRLQRLSLFAQSTTERHLWLSQNKRSLLALTVGGAFIASGSYFFYVFNWRSFPVLCCFTLVSLFYAYAPAIKGFIPFRNIPFLKIHLIALTWVTVVYLWPAFDSVQLGLSHVTISLGIYLYLIAVTIPFDIRDLPYDSKTQQTIPQRLGVTKARLLGLILLVIALMIFGALSSKGFANGFLWLLVVGHAISLLYASHKRSELFFALGIDGWLFWLGFVL